MPNLPAAFQDSEHAAAWYDTIAGLFRYDVPAESMVFLGGGDVMRRPKPFTDPIGPELRRISGTDGYIGGLTDPRTAYRAELVTGTESLPSVQPPATGWSQSTIADTFRYAHAGLVARRSAAVQSRIAGDPSARSRAAEDARRSADQLASYAEDADAAVRSSSAAWLPALPQPTSPGGTAPHVAAILRT